MMASEAVDSFLELSKKRHCRSFYYGLGRARVLRKGHRCQCVEILETIERANRNKGSVQGEGSLGFMGQWEALLTNGLGIVDKQFVGIVE